jgi:hypothetical protein
MYLITPKARIHVRRLRYSMDMSVVLAFCGRVICSALVCSLLFSPSGSLLCIISPSHCWPRIALFGAFSLSPPRPHHPFVAYPNFELGKVRESTQLKYTPGLASGAPKFEQGSAW